MRVIYSTEYFVQKQGKLTSESFVKSITKKSVARLAKRRKKKRKIDSCCVERPVAGKTCLKSCFAVNRSIHGVPWTKARVFHRRETFAEYQFTGNLLMR